MIDDGGSAFPTLLTGKWAGTRTEQVFAPDATNGMSLRAWFAGLAMQGLLANPDYVPAFDSARAATVADHARQEADALIAVLKKEQP